MMSHFQFIPCVSLFLLAVSVLREQAVAIHLDTLLARGDSSLAISWTPDSTNTDPTWYRENGSGCTGSDTIYRHCDFLPGVTYYSIAYSYGGEDGFLRFREKVESGFLIGSHLCHYNAFGDPSPVVAGTDCSGFVCYLWDVPRVSTRGLHSGYTAITRDELDVGDILVKPGSHALLIVEKIDDGEFLIWESTSVVNGCRERTINLGDTYWDAYYAHRYEGIVTRNETSRARSTGITGFPSVSVKRNGFVFSILREWTGTVEIVSGSGKILTSSAIKRKRAFTLPSVMSSAGVVIVRYTSSAGDTYAVSRTCIP